MGQDAFMEPFSNTFCDLQCNIYFLLLGICSALRLTVPSHTIHGIEGQPLHLTVDYNFNTTASEIQIIWLFEKPQSIPKYLLGSVNQSVVPDLEYKHKFTLIPPNASLMINPLHVTDEGNYIVKVNVHGNGTISANQKIQVTVDVPVAKPVVQIEPSSGVVEYVGNMTLTCTVGKGTRIGYQWMKNGKPMHASSSYTFSPNNDTLLIVPVMKEDIGNYSCFATNPVSAMESEIIAPTIFYGPYGLTVNSDKGLKVGEVFTVDIGEAILFDCSADSNPPNTYSWIRRADNTTHVIKYGPHLEVLSEKVAQTTVDYMCCAYNNVTGKRDETHFTVIITSVGLERLAQKGKSLSSLAVITGISLFLILSMSLLFLWKRYQPHKVIQRQLQSRPGADYRKAQTFSGHENATDDFGIYEFVAFPDPTGVPTVPSQSVSGSDFVQGQDLHSTVYEVIQHIPEQQEDHQEGT
ncbi:HEPACAM family member 2 isoform X1 [Chrysemys picta bellii]|uniref:HEPACAM family member 2 isoform X1 n=2 Tax=Chrysemys picta bellii TaxID=8478 RepID=UPI001C66E351|nr:HEPACAM family member 2 isoform X1 [Chrysemys picta bellii]